MWNNKDEKKNIVMFFLASIFWKEKKEVELETQFNSQVDQLVLPLFKKCCLMLMIKKIKCVSFI